MAEPPPTLTIAVEGDTDAAVARRLAEECDFSPGICHVTGGKHRLDRRLSGYLHAAKLGPWFVLRDLDRDESCAATLRRRLAPVEPARFILRIPVRSSESWLLADRKAIADFLKIPQSRIPADPDQLVRPKRTMVDLARGSRDRSLRNDMVPEEGLSVEIGPGYTTRLLDFVTQHWNPRTAAPASDSLSRCLKALETLRRAT